MKIEGENRKKLAQVGKDITSSSKKTLPIDSEDESIKKILFLVQNNGKLSVDEQIVYMRHKGITFKHINEKDAKVILANNTYYYKVTSFRKNIEKKNNKYVDVDFGMLNDLATIDMYLRYILIKLNLDIEHTLKAKLVNVITDSKIENGYTIVQEYDDYCKDKILSENPDFDLSTYIAVDKKIMSRNKDSRGYHYDLYVKRKNDPPIWVLIELMSFGELIRFIEFYFEKDKYNCNLFYEAYELLKYTKNFRDSAAHSRPLLINITKKRQIKPTQKVTEFAGSAGIEKLDRKQSISNMKIHDLICILLLHDKYIQSNEMKINRKKELIELRTRCLKRSCCYNNHEEFKKVFEIFSKIVDYYNF